jgi:uncharacterized membrane protein YhhN
MASLSLLILLSASLNIYAEYHGPRRLVYIFKPLTTALIIALALMAPVPLSFFYQAMIVIGLIFSLGGDIFLMLPADRFVAGLISFLFAHLFYIVAFVYPTGMHVSPLLLALYLVYGGIMVSRLWPHLDGLRIPVLIYMAVILVMGWQSVERWRVLQTNAALLAAIGATFFVVSDSTLALNRFRSSFTSARLLVLCAYFAAQWFLALSVNADGWPWT